MRLVKILISVGFLLGTFTCAFADTRTDVSLELLPARIGNFRKVSTSDQSNLVKPGLLGVDPEAAEQAEFAGNGHRIVVDIIRFRQDNESYELVSLMAAGSSFGSQAELRPGFGGTAGYVRENEAGFFKGRHVVRLNSNKPLDAATRDALVSELGKNLNNGEGDIPALIKHLPTPEEAQKNAIYLHSFDDLSVLGYQSPVYSAIQSGRNADAVLASYGPSKMLIVEFNTPQLATDNDRRIIARIQELWKLGQPSPTAYRRVGNYSVFVFDAPNEQTAKQLIDQVKYEQVVQWLGENPNIYKEAEKHYINTTLGVLVAVVKASGYALIACLGLGGLLGGLLFTYRRSQQKDGEAYSDAGGMLRLNLDDLTPETDPGRLLRERN